MDEDTAQASKQGHAKTTPVMQGPTDAQHYSEAGEPVTGCIQDPSAGSPQGFHGSLAYGRSFTTRQQKRGATPWTSATKQTLIQMGNSVQEAKPPQSLANSVQEARSKWHTTSRIRQPVRYPLEANGQAAYSRIHRAHQAKILAMQQLARETTLAAPPQSR